MKMVVSSGALSVFNPIPIQVSSKSSGEQYFTKARVSLQDKH
jgi:hypothetical protein